MTAYSLAVQADVRKRMSSPNRHDRPEISKAPYWLKLQRLDGITPISLIHGYAWQAHKCGAVPMHVGDAAALMEHDPRIIMK